MSTKGQRSLFMLVRVQQGGLRKIIIPVPLFVLNLTVKAVADLLWLPNTIFPNWHKRLLKHINKKSGHDFNLPPDLIIKMVLEFFNELRQYGRWRMVEVESGKNRVYIDFF